MRLTQHVGRTYRSCLLFHSDELPIVFIQLELQGRVLDHLLNLLLVCTVCQS